LSSFTSVSINPTTIPTTIPHDHHQSHRHPEFRMTGNDKNEEKKKNPIHHHRIEGVIFIVKIGMESLPFQ
jgi:hypothetical protein